MNSDLALDRFAGSIDSEIPPGGPGATIDNLDDFDAEAYVEQSGAWPLAGHDWAVDSLRQTLANNSVAHAYLLTGPSGIGKGTLARAFAATLNCRTGTLPLTPCGQCSSCLKFSRGNHPDIQILNLATQAVAVGKEANPSCDLGIEVIRGITREISLRPYESRWKVYIIEDAETLTLPAANALLKTLEEPPPYAIILLVAQDSKLLSTIVSRCRVLHLRALPRGTVQQALEAQGMEPVQAKLLAALSFGRLGWAIRAGNDEEFFAGRETELAALEELIAAGYNGRLTEASRLSKLYTVDRAAVVATLTFWLGYWRDILLVAGGCPTLVVNVDRAAALARLARLFDLAECRAAVQTITTALGRLEQNVNTQLALEQMLLQWPRPRRAA